ncbi:HD domain-containing protein [Algoriphagus machipongonensis]|uniref:HDIG domain protein n=1 Tax=Algoriphagus machipongonensis TaxID=388413 RepID=A3I386_9BACT|nr:HD domain-containing protein [Algoriphagus machipongonensis]EAZ79112.1 HDIG domain protein [Algoriphagus machipongonensis]
MVNSSLKLNKTSFGSAENAGNVITEKEALELLNDWVKNEKLIVHMKQVAHLMKEFAASESLSLEEQHKWYLAGLLHDADWDQWPEQHCKKIILELESRKIDPEIIRAIASHGPRYFGVEPETKMDKMLYAFDELSGLIHAYSLMRPTGYEGMQVKGVKKRLKDKTFAAQVSREDINDAAERANVSIEDLVQFVIIHQKDAKI